MSRQSVITEEICTEFAVLVAGGMQRKAAAQQVGYPIKSLRAACKRLGLDWPGRTLLSEQIKEFEPQILAGTISQHQIAKELDCSQPQINRLYKKLGYPSLPAGDPGSDALTKAQRAELCEKVIAHIETHGGYLKSSLRELEIPMGFAWHVRKFAKEIGFDFERYRFAHRQYGYWLTLPGKAKPVYTCDYLLSAVCTKCGTTHEVTLVNLKSKASTMCRACSHEERQGRPLCRKCKCVETGETIRSIRQLSQKLGIPHSTVEYNFTHFEKFEHDGLTYVPA